MRGITRGIVVAILGTTSVVIASPTVPSREPVESLAKIPLDPCDYFEPCRDGETVVRTLPASVTHYPCNGKGQAPEGAIDETADLQAWIDSVPDGELVTSSVLLDFPDGRCIRMDGHLSINSRHYLIFDGGGVTFDQHRKPAVASANGMAWSVSRGSYLVWHAFKIVGNHPEKITEGYPPLPSRVSNYGHCHEDPDKVPPPPTCEWQGGWGLYGAQHVTLEGNETKNTHGDSVEIGWWRPNCCNLREARYITINNHSVYGAGRQGISTIGVQDLTISNSYIEGAAQAAIDLEPESTDNVYPIRQVTITNNLFGQSHATILANNGQCTEVSDITFANNVQIQPNISGWPAIEMSRPVGCERNRGRVTITNNRLWVQEWQREGDVAAIIRGYVDFEFTHNSIKHSCGRAGCDGPNVAPVQLWGGGGYVVGQNDLAVSGSQAWPAVYAFDGVIHGSLGTKVSMGG